MLVLMTKGPWQQTKKVMNLISAAKNVAGEQTASGIEAAWPQLRAIAGPPQPGAEGGRSKL